MYENRKYNGNLVLSLLTGIIGAIMLLSLSIMIIRIWHYKECV